jgi:hypothetical protein
MQLSWSAPNYTPGPEVSGYIVEYSSDGGTAWNVFTQTNSDVKSVIVTGLTNDIEHRFRVAALNSVGSGSYSNTAVATPYLASIISITQQPKNNFSMAYNDNASFEVVANITNGGTLSYEWQYYGYDWDTYQNRWFVVPGQTSSTFTISPQSSGGLYNLDYYTSAVKFRCVLTGTNGADSVVSQEVKWLQFQNIYGYMYAYGQWGTWSNGNETIDGKYFEALSAQPGESVDLNLYEMSYFYLDSSWYSSDAFTVKIQESTNGVDWTDIHTANYRSNGFYDSRTMSALSGETRYYRAMLYVNWPFVTTDGSESVVRSVNPTFLGGVKITWPTQ